jgi:aryl-alcohol dehydrogenase-like predicted oxidoreductase
MAPPNRSGDLFYRDAQNLRVSNIGLGTYLGAMDDATDSGYTDAVMTAVRLGLNVIDTSLNYRNQRSERAVGEALRRLFANGEGRRDELVICTKAGFLVSDAVPAALKPEDVVDNMHSMAPEFLADQLERSRRNLGLDTIDVFYLHNPETQLNRIARDEFHSRIRRAFAFLEEAVAQGKIRFYGTATWDGYRRGPGAPEGLSLAQLNAEAEAAGGAQHHFRFIQLPFNLAMPEAYAQQRDGENVLTMAARLGITAVASASILQSRLSRNLPEELAAKLPGVSTDAQRAIQFTRSTPGITTALVGMSKPEHVRENLGLAVVPPLSEPEYRALYRQG